jgi:hypothetical protein
MQMRRIKSSVSKAPAHHVPRGSLQYLLRAAAAASRVSALAAGVGASFEAAVEAHKTERREIEGGGHTRGVKDVPGTTLSCIHVPESSLEWRHKGSL